MVRERKMELTRDIVQERETTRVRDGARVTVMVRERQERDMARCRERL